ncbi:deoxyribose-phosphate aldolase [Corynebacterium falsenii DSM 44353]|uniref:Deoxyribose-phosphate aldolase n=1 Tax=Corynebacterium falsenii TaxID=108486 RepID=A0A418Q582_9CORY|nr:deoxyribose-phosphate aldolase [Corynebacterium falsenii]AHI03991.1 deoxyribose-phosphate aldolase [Corynebacterium falsenii DSM 44353]RIX33701.1 deoxyribose-phosphate aldolase [Corynebacterium falsenii]UBI04767.1 deoxyribose-phosphate aldolase [Corynebacterium falsenii]
MEASALSRDQVAAAIDSTLLAPEATRQQVADLIGEAEQLGCGAVCVSPSMLPVGSLFSSDATLRLATVCGFPSGKHASLVKATEARWAVEQGAHDINVMVDLAAAVAGDTSALISELMTIREAVPKPVVLSVIVESAVLGEQQLRTAVRTCAQVGADYVKTSTGFHPAGGATVEAVRIMADELRSMGVLAPFGVDDQSRQAAGLVGIKASGGIRDWDPAVAMIAAGATRLGVSHAGAIVPREA